MNTRTRGPGLGGVSELARLLSTRDRTILTSLGRHRFLTTQQIEHLVFTDHASALASARACRRVLRRLDDWQLVARLDRRVGGFGAGSATSVRYLAPAGARALSFLSGEGLTARIREPSIRFVAHALAIAEAHVRLQEAARAGRFELVSVEIEQESWRSYLNIGGGVEYVKPDLAVVTSTPEFEDSFFLEVDLGTEHVPTIIRKCQQYQTYRRTGIEQADANIFPVVIWIAQTDKRREKLAAAIAESRALDHDLFRVTDIDDLVSVIAGGAA